MPGFCPHQGGATEQRVFWLAGSRRGVSPRFEVLRIRENACDLHECAELHAALFEYVASSRRGEALYADFWRDEGADAICGPSSGACVERVRVLRTRLDISTANSRSTSGFSATATSGR